MARYTTSAVSQTAILAGMNATTTVNGWIGYLGAGASAGFRLRRVTVGVRAGASVPTSQQVTIELHRQTVAPAGTGLATVATGQAQETWVPTDPTAGLIFSSATTIGTTGPTVTATPMHTITFNTQSTLDYPVEFTDELICNAGTANGIAFVNIGNTLPAAHFYVITVCWEV